MLDNKNLRVPIRALSQIQVVVYTLPRKDLQQQKEYTMKPIPLGAYIPPVTGINVPGSVFANSFDTNNVFRPRTYSKRRREDFDSDLERRFDLTRDYPPLVFPERQGIDVGAAALVEVSAMVPAIRELASADTVTVETKKIADFSLSVFALLETLWEKVVRPSAANPGGAAAGRAPVPPPKPDRGRQELLDALAASEKTSILYDANLGEVPMANRQKLSSALSAGMRAAAVDKAIDKKQDPAEAVRVADDALSLVTNMTFLGQASAPPNKEKHPNAKHCTMPIRLEFEDKGSRIHFERTLIARCGLRATQSLPKNVRIAQKKYLDSVKGNYPGEIVMIRVDAQKLRFCVFHKEDGGPKWIPGMEFMNIPYDILSGDGGGAAPLGGGAAGGGAVPPVDGAAGGMEIGD